MRTPIEALREIRDRMDYFCARLDGKYDPPWAAEIVGIVDDVEAGVNQDKTYGNTAKMREAVEACLFYLERIDHGMNDYMRGLFETAYKTAKDALAAPARNCDKYDKYECVDAFVRELADGEIDIDSERLTVEELDNFMRANWFLFKIWLYAREGEGING